MFSTFIDNRHYTSKIISNQLPNVLLIAKCELELLNIINHNRQFLILIFQISNVIIYLIYSFNWFLNPFNPKYLEWYSPYLDMGHTIQVCRGERVNICKYLITLIATLNRITD